MTHSTGNVSCDLRVEASLHYVVETLHDLRDAIPAEAGPLLPHLLNLMCLEATEISGEFAARRVRASLSRSSVPPARPALPAA